jgi:hypothetical protein
MKTRLLIVLILISARAYSADTLKSIAERPMLARRITTDELGNIYAIHTDNTLARYNERGDSTGFYRSTLNGLLGTVDATNPLRVLLYFPSFNKVQLLDRQLVLKAEVDLRPLRILSQTAVAMASDGKLWVYDPFNAKLIKVDESGVQITESIDLRQQLSFVPKAGFLLERDRRVYMCDTAQGILVFDQFATYVTTLPFKGIAELQAFDQQIVYSRGDTLHSYNMQTMEEQIMPLPGRQWGIVDVSLSQRALVLLYLNKIGIYSWPLSRK